MHKEIFNPNQIQLLPLVKQFKKEFYLVGGTAIALHIGHRRSIDFDLFKLSNGCDESICSGKKIEMERLCRFVFYPERPLFNSSDITKNKCAFWSVVF